MSDAEEERAGLVQTHAYAVLSMVDIKGLKLLQLKNPWSHRRWKVSCEVEHIHTEDNWAGFLSVNR